MIFQVPISTSSSTIGFIAVTWSSHALHRADDWEDWEDESFEPKLTVAGPTTIAAQRPVAAATAVAPDEDKFAGEDEGEDEPAYKAHIPEPQQVSRLAAPRKMSSCGFS